MRRTLRVILTSVFLLWSGVAFSAPININTADAETLAASLKGIGTAKAQAIIDYREKHGAFTSLAALADVKGIGEATIEKNRANMVVGEEQQ